MFRMFRFASSNRVMQPASRERAFAASALLSPVLFLALVGGLSGCGMGKIDTTVSSQPVIGAAMQGRVRGGNQPVTGATIQLYAAGVTPPGVNGYGSAPRALLTPPASTDGSGTFSITGQYSCPDADGDGDSQVYLVASGGNPGLPGTVNNGALVLMAALGSCNQLLAGGASIFIDVNEVSTVAAAYSLAQFAVPSVSGHGIDIGTSGGNVPGLNSAMKTVNNLVNLPTGTALSITPYYKALGGTSGGLLNSSYVPQARINTLADALAPCVNSTGTDGACTSLFNAAKAPGGFTPTDTLQAILSIAQHPGNNPAGIWGLPSSTPPFQPTLTSAPTDFALALTYTGGGMGVLPGTDPGNSATLSAMAIDATGNIWLSADTECFDPDSGTEVDAVFELDNQGNALSPASTAANSSCGGYLAEYMGTPVLGLGQPGGLSTNGIAVDLTGDIWVATNTSIGSFAELNSDGTLNANSLFNATTFGGASCTQAGSLLVDGSNNLWYECHSVGGAIGENSAADGTPITGQTFEADGNTNLDSLGGIALDLNGNLWAVPSVNSTDFTHLYQFNIGNTPPTVTNNFSTSGGSYVTNVVADGLGDIFSLSPTPGTINVTRPVTNGYALSSLSYPLPSGAGGVETMAIDGAGNLWGAAYAGAGISNNAPASLSSYLVEMTSTGTLLSPQSSGSVYGYTGTGGGGETEPILANFGSTSHFHFAGVAVDSSGNIWVANNQVLIQAGHPGVQPAQQLVEFVGIAPPVLTPMAAALASGQVGVSPQVKAPMQPHK